MNALRWIALAAALTFGAITSAHATVQSVSVRTAAYPPIDSGSLGTLDTFGGAVFAQAPSSPAPVVPPAGPPATQNTITTTAPVSSETNISVGTLAGQLLAWVVLAFSGPIGGIAVWILVRVLNYLGVKTTDALRARMQEFAVNALNVSAPIVEAKLAGQGQVAIKNATVQAAVTYVQTHGADTIKALGLDPQSGAAVEAIKARIETAIADPSTPTPAVLDPIAAPKAAVPPPPKAAA